MSNSSFNNKTFSKRSPPNRNSDYRLSDNEDESCSNLDNDDNYQTDLEENNKLLENSKKMYYKSNQQNTSQNGNQYTYSSFANNGPLFSPTSGNSFFSKKKNSLKKQLVKFKYFLKRQPKYKFLLFLLLVVFLTILILVIVFKPETMAPQRQRSGGGVAKSVDYSFLQTKICTEGEQKSMKLGECSFSDSLLLVDYSCTPISGRRSSGVEYQQIVPSGLVNQVTVLVIVDPVTAVSINGTIQSVLKQSWQQFKIVLVLFNIDEKVNFPEKSSFKDRRISYSNDIMKHLNSNEYGDEQSDYILLLESGDLLETTAIEKMVWKLKSNDAIDFTKGYTVNYHQNYTLTRNDFKNSDFFKDYHHSATLFKREVFSGISFFNELYLFKDLYENGYWGEMIPEYLHWSNKDKRDNSLVSYRFKVPAVRHSSFQNNIILPKLQSNRLNPLEKKRPRLLLIVPWLSTGGADKFNFNLAKEMKKNGWEITILTTISPSGEKSFYNWLYKFQLITHDIFIFSNFLESQFLPTFTCYLIDSRSIDQIILSNSEIGYNLLPHIRNHCHVQPLIFDYNHMEEDYWKNGGYPRYSIYFNSYLDRSLVSSHHLKSWIINNSKISESSIEVLYANIDLSEYQSTYNKSSTIRSEIRKKYNISPNEIVVVYAARLTDQKQPLYALEILKELKQSLGNHSNIKVLFVGDGPLRAQVDEYVQRFSLNQFIKILGDVPLDDMKLVLYSSDIAFLPSKFEGISMFFYESMSVGLTPIGFDIGGQFELIKNNRTGFLIKNQSNSTLEKKDYIKTLQYLIKNPKEIHRIGNNAQRLIQENFTIKNTTSRLNSLICSTSKTTHEVIQNENPLDEYFTIQSLELIKTKNDFEKKLREASHLSLYIKDDNDFHSNLLKEKNEFSQLLEKHESLEKQYQQIQVDYKLYVTENEKLFLKYEENLEKLNQCLSKEGKK